MISPQEKAEELYDKFYAWYPNQDAQFIAKQCALIVVDEILSMGIFSSSGDWQMAKPYWEEVKTEIENYDN